MKFILLALVLFASCSKKEEVATTEPSGFQILVKKNSKTSSGQVLENDAASIVTVYKADGRDFDLTKTLDLMGGYAYDEITSTSIEYDYTDFNGMYKKVSPGRYFVFVQLRDDGQFGGLLIHTHILM